MPSWTFNETKSCTRGFLRWFLSFSFLFFFAFVKFANRSTRLTWMYVLCGKQKPYFAYSSIYWKRFQMNQFLTFSFGNIFDSCANNIFTTDFIGYFMDIWVSMNNRFSIKIKFIVLLTVSFHESMPLFGSKEINAVFDSFDCYRKFKANFFYRVFTVFVIYRISVRYTCSV